MGMGRWSLQRSSAVIAAALCLTLAVPARAQDLSVSASVDRTQVEIREPIELTLTFKGDLERVKLPTFTFPEGLVVAARSQATNFSMRAGAVEREMSLTFVLVPTHPGAYDLGPFSIEHHGTTFSTETIQITVEKPAVPPDLPSSGTRYFL